MNFLDYIQGKRKGKEAHRIEMDSMNDPFLADAIEGFDSVKGDHAKRIMQMQEKVAGRSVSETKRSGAWKIAVAAVVFIALLGGYFTLMNHESNMMAAKDQDSNNYLTLYAPASYVEKKNLELGDIQEENSGKEIEVEPVVHIVNLNEVIKPVSRIKIYIPDTYYAQLNKKEIEELSASRNRILDTPVNIQHQEAAIEERAEESHYLAEAATPEVAIPAAVLSEEKDLDNNAKLNNNVSASLSGKMAGVKTVEQPKELNLDRRMEAAKTPAPVNNYLTGRIVDATDNEPIIGASVILKGTNVATVTDIDGYYKLPVGSATDADIIASYLGYETIEVPKPKNDQVLAMKADNQLLDEVVVTGYGVQKRASTTGSASVIKADKQVKIKPKPVIGEKEYKKYLETNLIKPESADCKNGKVVLEFQVDTSGRPYNITIKKSLCEAYDKEAISLIEEGPDWTYGTEIVKVEVKF